MNVIIFGPPLAGKGTQSKKIILDFGLTHLSTGDALRSEKAAQTDLGIKAIELLTNNPKKIEAIANSSIEIKKRVPLDIPAKKENYGYLKTKKEEMGHLLSVNGMPK